PAAAQGGRFPGHELGHHRRRGALARSARRRCRDRAGLRGWRSSRVFLSDDIATQAGTFALVPQIVDAVKVPVIAAGAITDARGIAAAFALGAAGVQMGTAYLWCPEAKISAPHRAALKSARDDGTALTNLMTGRPARGFINRLMREVGPISEVAPEFPLAAGALAPLRAKAEAQGSGDFSPMWAGQAASLGRDMPAGQLTKALAAEGRERMRALAGSKT